MTNENSSSHTIGARIYQKRCASCHGITAMGSSFAPSLAPIFNKGLTEKDFFELVLRRYDSKIFELENIKSEETVLMLRREVISMPNWEADLVVNSHINDLYAFLSTLISNSLADTSPSH